MHSVVAHSFTISSPKHSLLCACALNLFICCSCLFSSANGFSYALSVVWREISPATKFNIFTKTKIISYFRWLDDFAWRTQSAALKTHWLSVITERRSMEMELWCSRWLDHDANRVLRRESRRNRNANPFLRSIWKPINDWLLSCYRIHSTSDAIREFHFRNRKREIAHRSYRWKLLMERVTFRYAFSVNSWI